ncbi:MAG: class I SAM-dependent methyltransferase [Xanthomonadales bacterium]|nr:class I SAM-dependent methyltransferase [Xanthomonadales bacterium]
MLAARLRRVLSVVRWTPLHPQWLLRFGRSGKELEQFICGRVLDVGCADRWLEKKIPTGSQYVSLDFPSTGGNLYSAKPDIFADAAKLPFLDGSFETVALFEVLEHVKDPQQAISEAGRVLSSGGKILVTIPFLYPVHDEPHDYQRYTRHGLEREVDQIGLTIETIEPSLGSAETSGLIMNIALSGMAIRAIECRHPAVILLPFIVFLIPVINIFSFLVARTFPSWYSLTAGYTLVASKK